MPQIKFLVYTFVGSWLWCYALAYIGVKLGERWDSDPTLRAAFHSFDAVIFIALVGGVTFLVWRRSRKATS